MRLPILLLAALLGLGATLTYAQDQVQPRQRSPEEIQKIMGQTMDTTMGAMIPLTGKLTEATLEAQLMVAERPETAERVAAFKKNLFDALRKKGFSLEQAMQITVATAMPSATPSGR